MKHLPRRTALVMAASVLAAPVASASAAPTVTLRVSSPWAFAGFPVTAKVTASEAGTISLTQWRKSRVIGPGWCVQNTEPLQHRVPSSDKPIAAGETVSVTIQPSSLAFAGGTPFARPNFETCADPQTSFDKLIANFTTADNTAVYTSLPKRLQRVW